MSFFDTYFIQPIYTDSSYNLVNTTVYALIAIAAFLGDDIFGEDEQPLEEQEMKEMLVADLITPHDENICRAVGLLNAVSGDEFLSSPTHFKRMVGAIVEGDRSARGPVHTRYGAQQRRLARPICPDQRDQRSTRHRQAHAMQRLDAPVMGTQVRDLQ